MVGRELRGLKKSFLDKDFLKQVPSVNDFNQLVDYPCNAYDDSDNLIFCYQEILDLHLASRLNEACEKTPFQKGTRTGGLKTESNIFGYRPRNPVRMNHNICSATSMSRDCPSIHSVLVDGANAFGLWLNEINPLVYEQQKDYLSEKILLEYRIGDCFTSGIINRNNPLQYHKDQGNIPDSWSVMSVFKHHIEGGYLILPCYEVAIELKHNSIITFSGQSIVHGVSPIKMLSKTSRRYSIVWYTQEMLKHCLPCKEEIARARQMRDEYETRRRAKDTIKVLDEILTKTEN